MILDLDVITGDTCILNFFLNLSLLLLLKHFPTGRRKIVINLERLLSDYFRFNYVLLFFNITEGQQVKRRFKLDQLSCLFLFLLSMLSCLWVILASEICESVNYYRILMRIFIRTDECDCANHCPESQSAVAVLLALSQLFCCGPSTLDLITPLTSRTH